MVLAPPSRAGADAGPGLARESRQKGWWQQYGEAVPGWFEVFVGLEAEAATVWGYDAEFVPGILRTEEYARAVHRAQLITATEDEIDRLVTARLPDGSRAVPAGRSPGGIVAAPMHDQGVRAQFGEIGVAKRIDDRVEMGLK